MADLASRAKHRRALRTRGPEAVHAASISTEIGLAGGIAHEDWAKPAKRKRKPKPAPQGRLGGLYDTGGPPLPPLEEEVPSELLWQPSPNQLKRDKEAKERRDASAGGSQSPMGSPRGSSKGLPLNLAHMRGITRHQFARIAREHEARHPSDAGASGSYHAHGRSGARYAQPSAQPGSPVRPMVAAHASHLPSSGIAGAASHRMAGAPRAAEDGFLDNRVVGGGSRGWVGGFNT